MIKRLRAVLDTNIYVSALLSRNPNSPAKEIIQRWLNDEFTVLICEDLLAEVIEKLVARGLGESTVAEFSALLKILAENITNEAESAPRVIQFDPDDDVIVACAVIGKADYLVTYDNHFDMLGGEYQGFKITKALPFLWAVRGKNPVE